MEQLGVADLAQGLEEARQLWQDWAEQDPRLASAPAVDGLRDWLMLVGIDAADEVLHALVQIGSASGTDCRPAAWVVAWALLPGAIAVARRAPADPETDALVASQALAGDPAVPLVAAPKGRRQRAGEHAICSRSGRNVEATIVGRAANRADRQVARATAAQAGFA
jgi:hypothetical protein